MPRFFFDMKDGGVIIDSDGVELPDQATAEREALKGLGALVSEELGQGHASAIFQISVRRETEVVFKATLSLQMEWP